MQSVALQTSASKYNGQKRRTSVPRAGLRWLQRAALPLWKGKSQMAHFAGGFIGVFFPPRGDVSTVDGKVHFIWKRKFCQVLFLGHGQEGRRPRGKTSSSSGSWERRKAFRGSERFNVTKVQVQNEKHFPFFLLSES